MRKIARFRHPSRVRNVTNCHIDKDRAEASVDVFGVILIVVFIGFLVAVMEFCIIYIDGAAIKHKINNELNNMSVQIAADAYTDVKEKNAATYKESFVNRQGEYVTQFQAAVQKNVPMESGNHQIDPNVKLEFRTVTEDAVEYQCTLAVRFRMNIFGTAYHIYSRNIVIEGVHNFKDETPAVDREQGTGNQQGDDWLG